MIQNFIWFLMGIIAGQFGAAFIILYVVGHTPKHKRGLPDGKDSTLPL